MMTVTVLGSGTVGWDKAVACAGFLVSVASRRILLDVGTGTLLSSRSHLKSGDIRNVDAIILSHFDHLDHVGDLPSLLFSMNYLASAASFSPRTKPLLIFGPQGIESFMEGLLRLFPKCAPKAMTISTHELVPGSRREPWEGIVIKAEKADHGTSSICIRIEAESRSVAYSGDTTACEGLKRVLSTVDTAIVECSYPGNLDAHGQHMNAPIVGRLAKEADVGRLVLTHRFPFATDEELTSEVASEFSGPVDLASPGYEICV